MSRFGLLRFLLEVCRCPLIYLGGCSFMHVINIEGAMYLSVGCQQSQRTLSHIIVTHVSFFALLTPNGITSFILFSVRYLFCSYILLYLGLLLSRTYLDWIWNGCYNEITLTLIQSGEFFNPKSCLHACDILKQM